MGAGTAALFALHGARVTLVVRRSAGPQPPGLRVNGWTRTCGVLWSLGSSIRLSVRAPWVV